MYAGLHAHDPNEDTHGASSALVHWGRYNQRVKTEEVTEAIKVLRHVEKYLERQNPRDQQKQGELKGLKALITETIDKTLDPVVEDQNRLVFLKTFSRRIFDAFNSQAKRMIYEYKHPMDTNLYSGSPEHSYTNGLAKYISHETEGLTVALINILSRCENIKLNDPEGPEPAINKPSISYDPYERLSETQKNRKVISISDLVNATFHQCIKYQCWDYIDRNHSKVTTLISRTEHPSGDEDASERVRRLLDNHIPFRSAAACTALELPLVNMMNDEEAYLLYLNRPVYKKRGQSVMFDRLYNFAVHNEDPTTRAKNNERTTGASKRLRAQEYLLDCLEHYSPSGNKNKILDELLNTIPMFFQELAFIKAHWERNVELADSEQYEPVMTPPAYRHTTTPNTAPDHRINMPKCTLILEESNLLDSVTEAIHDFKLRQTWAHHTVDYKWGSWTLSGYYHGDISTMYFMLTTIDTSQAAEGLRAWHNEITTRINHGGQFSQSCVDVRAFQDTAYDMYMTFYTVCGPHGLNKANEKLAQFDWYAREFKLPVSLYDPHILYNEGVDRLTTFTMSDDPNAMTVMFAGYQPYYPLWMSHNASSCSWRF